MLCPVGQSKADVFDLGKLTFQQGIKIRKPSISFNCSTLHRLAESRWKWLLEHIKDIWNSRGIIALLAPWLPGRAIKVSAKDAIEGTQGRKVFRTTGAIEFFIEGRQSSQGASFWKVPGVIEFWTPWSGCLFWPILKQSLQWLNKFLRWK